MQRLAYLVLAHADPAHLRRLVLALGPDADVWVHVDAKSDLASFQAALSGTRAVLLTDRVRVAWADMSMVHATLRLMRAALAAQPAVDRLVLLSGACYPLRSPQVLQQFFDDHPNKEFIRYFDMRESPDHYMKQVLQRWYKRPWYEGRLSLLQKLDKGVRRLGNLLRLPNAWPSEFVPYFGSQWWALTAPCARDVLATVDADPRWLSSNTYSFSPDEHFFHSVVGNSNHAVRTEGVQAFEGRGTWRMANLHLVHPSLQKWYSLTDWAEVATSDRLFIRKVRSQDSGPLLDRIDAELRL